MPTYLTQTLERQKRHHETTRQKTAVITEAKPRRGMESLDSMQKCRVSLSATSRDETSCKSLNSSAVLFSAKYSYGAD